MPTSVPSSVVSSVEGIADRPDRGSSTVEAAFGMKHTVAAGVILTEVGVAAPGEITLTVERA